MFNIVQWYKFRLNDKIVIVPAVSLIAAIDTLENEGYTDFSYIGIKGDI